MKTPKFNLQNFAKENVNTFSKEELSLIHGGTESAGDMCSNNSDTDSGRNCSVSNDTDTEDPANPVILV